MLRAFGRRLIAERDGAVAVESVFLLPLLLLLAIGLVDVGLAVYQTNVLTSAARAGVAIAAARPTDSEGMRTAVLAAAPVPATASVDVSRVCACPDGTPVACTATCAGNLPSLRVRVSVSQSYTPLFPWPGLPGEMALNGSAEFRVR